MKWKGKQNENDMRMKIKWYEWNKIKWDEKEMARNAMEWKRNGMEWR